MYKHIAQCTVSMMVEWSGEVLFGNTPQNVGQLLRLSNTNIKTYTSCNLGISHYYYSSEF